MLGAKVVAPWRYAKGVSVICHGDPADDLLLLCHTTNAGRQEIAAEGWPLKVATPAANVLRWW